VKTIIAGSRDIVDVKILYDAIKKLNIPEKEITQVISGGARGADRIGEIYANENAIDLVIMPANWNLHGKSAGYRRNEDMAKIADACIALWDGSSKGTGHMINLAEKYNLKLWVYDVSKNA
jgi:hypothetical protein